MLTLYDIHYTIWAIMDKDKLYTTFDVVRILGIKMERLQDWLKRGYIQPVHEEAVGRGIKKYFGRLELYVIKAFQYMVENGITRAEAAKWVGNIRKIINIEPSKLLNHQVTILFVKGYDPKNQDNPDAVFVAYDLPVELDFENDIDAYHALNFSKIVRLVDSRLEE